MPTGDVTHFLNTNDPQSARDYSGVQQITRLRDNGDGTVDMFMSDGTNKRITGIAIADLVTRINGIWA